MYKILFDLTIFLFISQITKIIYSLLIQPICILLSKSFPTFTFKIPKKCNPIINTSTNELIPKIIFQTDKTSQVSFAFYINFLILRLFNPTFEYRFYDDNDIDAFIKLNYKCCYDYYKSISIGAFKSDLFRILVLHHYGGFYIDTDRSFFMPLIYNKNKEIVLFNDRCLGYNVKKTNMSNKNDYDIFCMDVFGFRKNNVILSETIKKIEKIDFEKNDSSLPLLFETILEKYYKLRLDIQVINISFIMHNHVILTNYLHYNFPQKRFHWTNEKKRL